MLTYTGLLGILQNTMLQTAAIVPVVSTLRVTQGPKKIKLLDTTVIQPN
jgi:hypothetical protein